MDALKAQQKAARTSFTRTSIALWREIQAETPDAHNLKTGLSMMTQKIADLHRLDNSIVVNLETDEQVEADSLQSDEYTMKFHPAKVAVEEMLGINQHEAGQAAGQQGQAIQTLTQNLETLTEVFQRPPQTLPGIPIEAKRTLFSLNETLEQLTARERKQYNLPKVDLPSFSGDVKEWLKYWSLFKNIHEDATLPKERKFHYFIQSIVKGSKAAEVVNSYPPTADNYDKAVLALKNHFGKDQLIVEVYVRELLRLVLNNPSDGKTTLSSLYDQLETQLRALESLGVNSEMYAALLYPLVESASPEELLRAWQRHQSTLKVTTTKERLEKQTEERIALAVHGFWLGKSSEKPKEKRTKPKSDSKGLPPGSGFLATTKEGRKSNCVFCEEQHDSGTCKRARDITLEQRQNIAREKNVCFNCLLPGHSAKICRFKESCVDRCLKAYARILAALAKKY